MFPPERQSALWMAVIVVEIFAAVNREHVTKARQPRKVAAEADIFDTASLTSAAQPLPLKALSLRLGVPRI
jgi:hypothetical protein